MLIVIAMAAEQQRKPRSSRERMVRSAALLFRERGFSGTGFRDVIAHSGAPRGSIYHHFPGGKAQLAEDTIRYATDAMTAGMEAAGGGGSDPVAALRTFLAAWQQTLERSDFRAGCPVVAIAVEAHNRPETLGAADGAFARWEALFAGTLRRAGVARGRASRLATLAVAAVEGAVVLCRVRRDTRPLRDVGRELEGVIEAALPVR
jgi:AcrR family transcriptional regulator